MLRIDLAAFAENPFVVAQQAAAACAARELDTPMELSWYDARRGLESPRGVSECSAAEPSAGVLAYARSRGGALCVDIRQDGRTAFLFCFTDCGVT